MTCILYYKGCKKVMRVPQWLESQLRRAFANKNRAQIIILNQCWYYYVRDIK
ncbi:cortex morphogenetic protein CmpA [Alkalibacillus flavidus]|uniref:cortex morphogenetic protein CmpA n=1 Tax=Alkalibacillus flavidus TaxID=546021 RepID=UPI0036284811